MNADRELSAVLPNLHKRRDAAIGRLREAEREVRNLDLAIEGIEGLTGAEDNGATDTLQQVTEAIQQTVKESRNLRTIQTGRAYGGRKLAGIAAVERALKAAPTGLTLTALTTAVRDLGWVPDTPQKERAVRAAANRLREKDSDFDYVDKIFIYKPKHAGTMGQASLGGEEP
jgi:hypothetical protein